MERCDALAAFTEDDGALTRRFATPALREASEAVREWMAAAGMAVREDAAGNLIGRYDGSDPGAGTLILGSHLDTVRDAGRYDGALGVLVGIAAVARLAEREERLPFALEVYAFSDEEGTRFGTAYLGSAAVAGRFDYAWLARRDGDGTTMADALRAYGSDPGALAGARRDPGDLIGYVEVHIEQGPVLERADVPVGIVESIAGQTRWDVELRGQAGHAGTVPMDGRRDALCAAAELVLAVEAAGRAGAGLVATVGELDVLPGAANVIPGAARLSVDVRHGDDAERREAVAHLKSETEWIAAQRAVEVATVPRFEHDAVCCDPGLVAALEHAVSARGLEPMRLVSGAGHDAVQLAALAPVAMLFVRCAGGVSHDPAESVAEGDVAVALDVLDELLAGLADERAAA
jgi:hydantoinase/carbamoylase family amidase